MEEKLKEYRARRRRQEIVEKTTERLGNTKRRFVELFKKMIKIDVDETEAEVVVEDNAPASKEVPAREQISKKTRLEKAENRNHRNKSDVEEKERLIEMDSENNEVEILDEKPPETWRHFIIKWSIYTVIWVTLYFYFISLQFGAVFFAFSLLIGIYLNTGTKPKKKGEVSAYSVFNENCESIEGTVTAEKLQREMFFNFGSFI